MSKQSFLIVVLFAVALGSGIFVGRSLPRAGGGPERSFLAEELKLTPSQREQMRAIWQEVGRGRDGSGHREAMRQLQKDREEAVVALLSTEQKGAYEKIQDNFQRQTAELNKDREAAVKQAVEKTKAILDEKQKIKYEEILKRGPGEGRGFGRWAASRPTTSPATERVPPKLP